jgi:formylglycine-generating enzyme required for sulfatase activity
MAFDLSLWKTQMAQRLQGWRVRMKQGGVHSIYAFVSAAALWPVAEAIGRHDPLAWMALGTVVGNLGTNLIANKIQQWKDEASAAQELEHEVERDAALRAELDAVLEQLGAMLVARNELPESDQAWFVEASRTELMRLGNWTRYETIISGGVNVQAQNVNFGGDVVGRDKIVYYYTIYTKPAGRHALSEEDFARILNEYLTWVRNAHDRARLYGLESLPTMKDRPVRTLADVFVPVTLRRFQPPRRDEVEQLAREFKGEMARAQAYLKLVEQGQGAGDEIALAQLLTIKDRLAIIGSAGRGKSTLLAYFAASLAAAVQGNHALPFTLPRGVQSLIPLLIPLRYYREYRRACETEPSQKVRDPRWGTLAGFVPWYLKRQNPVRETSEDFFDRLLLGGGCLLMLDGLDEVVSREERARVRAEVERLANEIYPGNRLLVTAREAGYREDAVFGDDFTRLDVQRLDDKQIELLVRNWCEQLYPDEVEDRTTEIVGAIENINELRADRDLRPLISTPLMTTMVISVKWGEAELPRERAQLYEACVKVVLQAQYVTDDPTRKELAEWGGAWHEQRDWLAALALEMQRGGWAGAAIPEARVREVLQPLLAPHDLDTFVEAVRSRGGLFEERAELFQFVHLTFQEFLAARALAKQRDSALPHLVRHIPDPWWRETLLLTYGFAKIDWAEFAQTYLNWLSRRSETDEIRLAGLELAGAAVLELEKPQPQVREQQAESLKQVLSDETIAAPAVLRARAGDTLARLGDSRFYGPDRFCLPVEPLLGFVEIPEGKFLMGSDKLRDQAAFEHEFPQHEVLLPTYYMARYPVTVDQFRVFVQDSGYQPRDEDSLRGTATHPVVNVTWYDALKYGEWLTEKLRAIAHQRVGETANQRELLAFWAGLRDGTLRVTLPSEAEWEKAARGSDGRIYPWGNDWDNDKLNAEMNIGRTSAVGCFPAGASPYGLLDMSGNVWEWTRSLWGKDWEKPEFKYPYDPNDKRREDLNASREIRRVLRGGAFRYDQRGVRCAYRDWVGPDDGDDVGGFRVVVSPFFGL